MSTPRAPLLRTILGRAATPPDDDGTVTIYTRTFDDRATGVTNARRLVAAKVDELARARRQLAEEISGFVDHCRAAGLPIRIDETIPADHHGHEDQD